MEQGSVLFGLWGNKSLSTNVVFSWGYGLFFHLIVVKVSWSFLAFIVTFAAGIIFMLGSVLFKGDQDYRQPNLDNLFSCSAT